MQRVVCIMMRTAIETRAQTALSMVDNPQMTLQEMVKFVALAESNGGGLVAKLVEAARDRRRVAEMNQEKGLHLRIDTGIEKLTKYRDDAQFHATANNVGQGAGAAISLAGGVVALAATGPIGFGVAMSLGLVGAGGQLTTEGVTEHCRAQVVREADKYFQDDYGAMVAALMEATRSFDVACDVMGFQSHEQYEVAEHFMALLGASEKILQRQRFLSDEPIDDAEVFLFALVKWGFGDDQLPMMIANEVPGLSKLKDHSELGSDVKAIAKFVSTACETGGAVTGVYKIVTQMRIADAVAKQNQAVSAIKAGKKLADTGRQMMRANMGTLAGHAVGRGGGDAGRVAQGAQMIEEGAAAIKEAKAVLKSTNKAKTAPNYGKLSKLSKGLTYVGIVVDSVTLVWCVSDLARGSPYPEKARMGRMIADLQESRPAFETVGQMCEAYVELMDDLISQ